MKILFSIPSLHRGGGGIVEVIPREAEELLRLGHEVRIVIAETDDYSDAAIRAERAGVKIYREPIHDIRGLSCLRVTKKYYREIVRLVDWADVVHINCLWMDASWVTAWICRRKNKPYLLQTHGALNPLALKKSMIKKWIIGNLIERANLNHANAVIATADNEKQGIIDFGIHASVAVVPIGLETEQIDRAQKDVGLLSRLSLCPNKRTLLFLSRVSPGKGLDMLADAWAALSKYHQSWQLLIAGPDDRGYTEVIKKLYADRIKDGSVVFHGPIYGDDKFTLLKSVDAFVLPTRSENWSIAVQEALAAGLPTVCTKGAPWSVIERDNTGYWVDIDVDSIRAGLDRVLGACAADLRIMSENGKHIVNRDFSWPTIAKSLNKLYGRIIVYE